MQNAPQNYTIGQNIRLYRIRAGFTVKNLCRRITQHNNFIIKPGSIRNYEAGREKIPAVALNAIAAETNTDIKLFYESPSPTVLIDTSQKLHLLEAFCMIRCRASRDSLLNITRKLGKRSRGHHA